MSNDSLIEKMEDVITPDNIALGHTWVKRKIRQAIRQHFAAPIMSMLCPKS